ncbi:MAG: serine--tRNA ligase, partial [Betaproteobacteria bacterium]|nr:serine--tRNA ligase [Betaproteobacteria bacterium]
MLDIQLLRSDIDAVAGRLADRGYSLDTAQFAGLEHERKAIQTETQDLQARRNALSKQIGQLKAKKEDASALMAEVNAQADQLKALEQRLEVVQQRLNDFLMQVPNVPHASVPAGGDAEANVEVRRVGTPKAFDFAPKDHVDIGEGLGLIDFETATKISRTRFVLMKGGLSRLHRALAQFMLDVHTAEHGYTEVYAPYLVNADSMRGTGQFPKFEEDQFAV